MAIPTDNSSLRYFLASLKPLGRFMFWGPLGLLALILIFYWQIQENPSLIAPVTEQAPTSPDSELRPTLKKQTTPPPAQAQAQGSKHWAAEYRDRLSQEQLQPFSIDRPDQRKKAQANSVLPQATLKNESLFMPLLPNLPQNSRPAYTPVKPFQAPSIPVAENQLQRAMDESSLRDSASGRESAYRTPTNPYAQNSPDPNVAGGINPNTPANPGANPYANQAPLPPYSASQYGTPAPNQGNPPYYGQQPQPPGVTIQPSIPSRY